MAISKKNRSDLKSYFVKNAIPTESQFSDLIDGALNQVDDGIFKLPDDPLSIVATGGPDSQKKTIQLYETYAADATPAWVLSLNPRANASTPATARPGFSISDSAGTSRLFIDKATGNVGIGTVAPAQTLHVNGGAKVRGFTDSLGVSVNDGSNTGVGRGLWLWRPSDSNHVIYSAKPNGKSPANNAPPAGFFDDGHRMRFRTYKGKQGFLFENHAEEALVDIDSGDGRLWAKGAIYAGNSDIYFTNTEHNHSGIGNTEGHAAIENAKSHNALMILGRAGTSKGRAVKLWDYLEVNGDLSVTRNVDIKGVMRATGGIRADGNLGSHVEVDGSFYRYQGQVYITVDDHLYIRDQNGDTNFHFQTNKGYFYYKGGLSKLSDARAKQDIEDLPYGLSEVKKLRPVTFNWKIRPNRRKTLGLLSQEVQGVLDEVVHDHDGELSITYIDLIPVLINAIKELDAKLEAARPRSEQDA